MLLINRGILFLATVLAFLFLPVTSYYVTYSGNNFVDAWTQWDADFFMSIAQNGYGTEKWNGSFPLYPFLMKFLGDVIGGNYALAGFLISNVALIAGMYFLYKLIMFDYRDEIGYKTIFYLIFFPTSFFLSAVYSESLFIALTIASFYFARKGKWLAAGILGFFTATTRLIGVLWIIPLAFEYLEQKKFKIRKIKADIIYLLLIPLGLLMTFWLMYAYTGDFFIYFKIQQSWHRSLTFPWISIIDSIRGLMNFSFGSLYHLFNLFIVLMFTTLLTLSIIIRQRKSYIIYSTINLLLALSITKLEAVSRFVLPIFPCFITLAVFQESKRFKKYKKTRVLIKIMYAVFFVLMLFFLMRQFKRIIPGLEWISTY
ncbi:MAG TPA: hypothetical protein VI894_01540 [Candidatus Nanoarchaeia archaeon]|nr:hypothetical protein [Candidatus Nanoarchaeia archaeon]